LSISIIDGYRRAGSTEAQVVTLEKAKLDKGGLLLSYGQDNSWSIAHGMNTTTDTACRKAKATMPPPS
jgi:hypothetical protein